MKGSLAACMLAAADAKRRGLRGDVIVTAVSDEEFASVGTEAVAASLSRGRGDRHRADGHAGRRRASWLRPSRGRDDRPRGARLAAAARDRRDREDGPRPRRHRGARPAAAGEPHASAPRERERARVADRGRAGVLELPGALRRSRRERRTIPGETAELAVDEIQAILERAAAADPDFAADVRARSRPASRSRSTRTRRS